MGLVVVATRSRFIPLNMTQSKNGVAQTIIQKNYIQVSVQLLSKKIRHCVKICRTGKWGNRKITSENAETQTDLGSSCSLGDEVVDDDVGQNLQELVRRLRMAIQPGLGLGHGLRASSLDHVAHQSPLRIQSQQIKIPVWNKKEGKCNKKRAMAKQFWICKGSETKH